MLKNGVLHIYKVVSLSKIVKQEMQINVNF